MQLTLTLSAVKICLNNSGLFTFFHFFPLLGQFVYVFCLHIFICLHFCRSRQLEIDEEIREIKSKQNEIENKKAQLEKKRAGIIEKITDYNVNYGSYNQKITKIINLKDKAKAANRTIEEYEKMQAEIQAEIENCKAEKDQKMQKIHHTKQKLENIRKYGSNRKSKGGIPRVIPGHRTRLRGLENPRTPLYTIFHI